MRDATTAEAAPSFAGLWNLRDLGGLPVDSGGRTRKRRLFRSGTLWFATMEDCTLLAGFAFDTCIDLRLPQEELHEDDWLCELLDLRYHHLPVEVPDDPKRVTLVHDGGPDHYLRLLEHNAATYVRAVEIISDPDNHPLLFHCAAGLDRTGLLAALALACLGVSEEAIVDDYVQSDVGIQRIIDRYRGHKLYGAASDAAAGRRVHGFVMREFLATVGGTSGLREWAIDNGLKDTSIERMRAALVEP
jgi:protein-tyrosine phosphatase